ncbi:MAG: Smr/MutS family protein [Chloroflexi bacterium]|nr:Smr/MutS family protein [Chloroflexota bacterium]
MTTAQLTRQQQKRRDDLRRRALRTLEFDKVRDRLADCTECSLGHEYALALEPAYSVPEVTRRRDETREALRLLDLRPSLSFADATDVRQLVRTSAIGGALSGLDLVALARTLGAVHSVRANLTRLSYELPTLAGVAQGLGEFRDLEAAIKRTVNPKGEVLDGASPLLTRLRAEARAAEERLTARLKDIIASEAGRRVLQEPFIAVRDDRYVLAVKAEHRGQVQGIIHDVSSSGATVFMEPLATVEMGNAYRELRLGEKREVERILREVAADVGAQSRAIQESIERLARLDLIVAKARLGRRRKAIPAAIIDMGSVEPVEKAKQPAESRKRSPAVILNDARHPLLTGDPVPMTLRLGDQHQALVVSGPNTGGKTVALKTTGLLALMAQAGIPIPADERSALQVFDGVYADIGDEQSIEQSLSTFSGHLSNIVEILSVATGRSLVLLDELGAGTDPQEGAAVAKAILSELVNRGTTTIVTTHHSEIKAFAHSADGVQNASVEFNSATLAPTYRLIVGLPGRSNALAIAERLGLPADVLTRARQNLGAGAVEVERLLGEIQEQRRKAEADRVIAEVEAIRKKLERSPWQTPRDRRLSPAKFQAGEMVKVEGITPSAEIITAPDERGIVQLQAGSMRLQVHQSMVLGKDKTQRPSERPKIVVPKAATVGDEFWVHGMRAQQAVDAVSEYIEKAALAGHARVRIIHGKGRGVLRSAIHRALGDHPLVGTFRDADDSEGGHGVTIVEL